MGTDYFRKAVLLADGISMLIFFHSLQAEAQVVIEEKMEIEPKTKYQAGIVCIRQLQPVQMYFRFGFPWSKIGL